MIRPPARPGFSLIEVLSAVAIAGILMAIAARGFAGARDRSSNSQVESSARQVQLAVEIYQADNEKFPAALTVAPPGATQGPEILLSTRFDKRYLPGNRLPATPWNPSGWQSNPLVAPATVADGGLWKLDAAKSGASRPLSVPRAPIGVGTGRLPPAGSRELTFIANTTEITYGSILYETNLDRSLYVLHGIGKRGRNALVVAISSNLR